MIDDQLDCLTGAKICTILDLENGFFHVPIDDDSCKFTAFVIPGGHYEFMRLPFGLYISPTYFQKFINIIFSELAEKGIIVMYMDDLIIRSATVTEGIERVKVVFKIASEYGLIFNWKKCHFLQTRVTYLGYIVENGTIRPSSEKTSAVENFPEPKNVKSIQSFLGLTGFFRKFVEGYATIARPLSNLTAKDVPFQFGESERDAFKKLKTLLCQKPVLALYSPYAETELHADASVVGLGAILLQRNDEDRQLHPVHYASWKTSKDEAKYESYRLEVLAIVKALKKFRIYLQPIAFKIITDCQAFTQTMKKKDIPPQIARWALLLEEFKYTIVHRAGIKMQHADALSRYPVLEVLRIDNDYSVIVEQIKKNQLKDEKLSKLITRRCRRKGML